MTSLTCRHYSEGKERASHRLNTHHAPICAAEKNNAARRRISAEKQASAASTDFTSVNNNLGEEFTLNDYDAKMKSKDVKNCLDRMDGNLSPASIRRRTTRSKSVQNSKQVSHDLSLQLPRRQVRSASDAQLSLDLKLQRRMGMSSVTSDETFDESEERDDHVSKDDSQLEDLISPRSWSDMIASDTSIASDGPAEKDCQHNSNNNNHKSDITANVNLSRKPQRRVGVLSKVYVEDVTFHDVNSNQPIRSFEPKEDLITPRTWDEMVAEDSASRDGNQDSGDLLTVLHRNSSTEEGGDNSDPLATSIEFAWPKDLPSNGLVSRDTEESNKTYREKEPGLPLARLEWNLRMLKRDLMLMKKTDQQIFRQLLSNYETIGQISDHVTVSPETPSPLPPSPPPFPVTPRSTPSSPEKRRSYSTTPGDTELLRIIREALDQPGPLNIRNIVTQLSPIRRRRSSEPTTIEYEDLPPGFGEDDEQELEDLLSLSCPVFKEPKSSMKRRDTQSTKL